MAVLTKNTVKVFFSRTFSPPSNQAVENALQRDPQEDSGSSSVPDPKLRVWGLGLQGCRVAGLRL